MCWYKCNMYYDTALERYRGLWNLRHCFGVNCLVVENLADVMHCGTSCFKSKAISHYFIFSYIS